MDRTCFYNFGSFDLSKELQNSLFPLPPVDHECAHETSLFFKNVLTVRTVFLAILIEPFKLTENLEAFISRGLSENYFISH